MNPSNITMEDQVYAGVFGCIMVIGLPLNTASLWILLRRHSLRSSNAILMVNLAISDLLLVISLPMRVYFHATGRWPLGKMGCFFITMLFRNNLRSSAVFITFISVDRLLAVVYPLRSRHLRTSCNAWKGAAVAWVIVLILNVPESVEFLKPSNHSGCFNVSRDRSPHLTKYTTIIYLVLVVTMLAVNIVCTVMVSWTLRSHFSDSAKVNNKVNVMLIFVMNLVLFTICFLPISIAVVTVKPDDFMPLICLSAVNCCLDPLLYYFSFDGFWKKKEDTDPAREQ